MSFRRTQIKYTKKPEPKATTADRNKPPQFWSGLPLSCNGRQQRVSVRAAQRAEGDRRGRSRRRPFNRTRKRRPLLFTRTHVRAKGRVRTPSALAAAPARRPQVTGARVTPAHFGYPGACSRNGQQQHRQERVRNGNSRPPSAPGEQEHQPALQGTDPHSGLRVAPQLLSVSAHFGAGRAGQRIHGGLLSGSSPARCPFPKLSKPTGI